MSRNINKAETESKNKTSIFGDELHTIPEVAAELSLTPDWFYQKIHSRTLPFPYVKVGHYVRIPASGVRRWIESQTREGVAQ